MFGQQHVSKQLSTYAHGELPAQDAARVAAHLGACARCRTEFEEISYGIRLAESLTTHAAPDSLWDNIEAALAQEAFKQNQAERAKHEGARENNVRGGWLAGWRSGRHSDSFGGWLSGWRPALAASFVLLLMLGAGGAWFYLRQTRTSWEVARLAGAPSIDADRMGSRGRLGVGEWLETDANSRAQIKVADIGQVEVDPQTRIRLVETGLTEHRLELARGRMHAVIYAPPRLFFVDTPSAVAADLGCAYTLEVDDAGRSVLHVTAGWVAFETTERESVVPAGASCLTQPGVGPGTPFFEDASQLFRDALARFDFAHGGGDALRAVIAEARPRDTLTLWHLLARVEGDERERVYERLAALAPPPASVTRHGIMLLDPAMLY
ncbi:MAG TPA: FecR domain-containing protein, partial [Pyrinomonadaceae bacterium]|nr:FecR domain-containing protein [Pyrinomonadaceae bacterium]